MDEDNALPPLSVDAPADTTPARRSPYELLMRQSRKMGQIAMRTYDATRQFLRRDVSSIVPRSPDAILFGKASATTKVSTATAVRRSHDILAAVKTIWLPINLFPDSIVVDRAKVTITRRTFFWTSEVITTRIEDILSVTANLGPFFGSIIIATRVMNSTDHYEIDFFWRRDAMYVKEIIQGYVIAQHNNLDTSHLNRDELIDTLLDLGRDSSV